MTHNKIALVTGASRGLGKESALQLADRGFDVVITYLQKKQEADDTVNEIRLKGRKSFALQLDISNSSQFDSFVQELKTQLQLQMGAEKIQALVNNAGFGYNASFADTTEEAFDTMATVHLKAPYFLTQKLLSVIDNGASIVNTSSGLARFSYPGYSAYGIMKAAVESMSRYQAKELGQRGIRVNTVAPGAIETDFGGGSMRNNQDLRKAVSAQTSLGRVGLPDDVGSVVAFLCSDDSKWINAQRIEVAGGIHI
ncbi:MAG: SDR family oxidoreductase [Chitinophagaceae bacterium]|nr:SDR family oxidoreductase [Chitinophagaceae bacterium]